MKYTIRSSGIIDPSKSTFGNHPKRRFEKLFPIHADRTGN